MEESSYVCHAPFSRPLHETKRLQQSTVRECILIALQHVLWLLVNDIQGFKSGGNIKRRNWLDQLRSGPSRQCGSGNLASTLGLSIAGFNSSNQCNLEVFKWEFRIILECFSFIGFKMNIRNLRSGTWGYEGVTTQFAICTISRFTFPIQILERWIFGNHHWCEYVEDTASTLKCREVNDDCRGGNSMGQHTEQSQTNEIIVRCSNLGPVLELLWTCVATVSWDGDDVADKRHLAWPPNRVQYGNLPPQKAFYLELYRLRLRQLNDAIPIHL